MSKVLSINCDSEEGSEASPGPAALAPSPDPAAEAEGSDEGADVGVERL